MAHNSDYSHIFVDTSVSPNVALSLDEVATAVERSTQDLGQLNSDKNASGVDQDKINPNALYKPYRASFDVRNRSTTSRVAANYGWDITRKAANSAMSNFLSAIDSKYTNGTPMWQYLKPRGGLNDSYYEPFLVQDFDGYRNNSYPYGNPITLKRILATSQASILSWTSALHVNADTSAETTGQFSPPAINGDGAGVQYRLTIEAAYDPNEADVSGWGDITYDNYTRAEIIVKGFYQGEYDEEEDVLYEDSRDVTQSSPSVAPSVTFNFAAKGIEGRTYLRFEIDIIVHSDPNYTIVPDDGQYISLDYNITFDRAAKLTFSNTGQDGIYVGLSEAASYGWRYNVEERNIFGNTIGAFIALSISNGTTTVKKLVALDKGGIQNSAVPASRLILYNAIDVSIRPRASSSADDIVIYCFMGNTNNLFPNIYNDVYYTDINTAAAYNEVITTLPDCRHKIGIIS